MASKIRWILVLVIVLAVVGILYFLLGSTIVANPASTRGLRTTFKEQGSIFIRPIASLGITGQPKASVQCVNDHTSGVMTYYLCLSAYNYPYSKIPIAPAALTNYPTNAAKFDQLLQQSGWINNQPHNSVTTLVDSNPYLPQNGGNGAELAFHKNIGTISCDMEINFNSLTGDMNPGSINVNYF